MGERILSASNEVASIYRSQSFRDPNWKRSAGIVADGIEQSGLVAIVVSSESALEASSAALTNAIMRSAVLTADAIDEQTIIVRANTQELRYQSGLLEAANGLLARQTRLLAEVESMMRRPGATEAQELYVRGSRALSSGWIPEAIADLTEATNKNPYDPSAQFARALALGASKDLRGSAEAFALTIRYSAGEATLDPIAAGAAILGARTYLELGDLEMARQIVESTLDRVGPCAELELFLAHLELARIGDGVAVR